MLRYLSAVAALLTAFVMTTAQNPFFSPFAGTPHGTPPFDKISEADYEPAIDRGIALARAEVDAIANNPEPATFANTIVALENVGADLNRVLNVFYPLQSALSSDNMMEIAERVTPRLSDYSTSISLNQPLWERVKTVYDNRAAENLTGEDMKLLQETYDSFVRSGALLTGDAREEYRRLSSRLSELTTKFGQNVLRELNTYKIWLTADDLEGLPQSQIDAAALAAKEQGREGEYLFTLDQPVYTAFLKYSTRPDLRERFWRLYNGRNRQGEYDNYPLIREIANTRLQIANLLGYKTYADYALTHTMAEKPENVYNLLHELRDAYRPAQEAEFDALRQYAASVQGEPVELNPWDYSYWSNKMRQAQYGFDEEALRPYFELDNVVDGVFGLATRLYGVTFRHNPDIPVYHPDVKAYEVLTPEGEYMGVIYTDFFPRDSKRPGAWMTDFKPEWREADGSISSPHVTIVMNFTKPGADTPSLLTPYEVETFLHEFGHALHGLMAATRYRTLSGTNVYRDFVELPSQFNENYLTQKAFLDTFAKHYLTGEPMPESEIAKMVTSAQYGAAYACLRQLNFGLVDMAWHSIDAPLPDTLDPSDFEVAAGASVAMFPAIEGTASSPTFSHIFAGGYAAGYYSYKWAEVLDADAFAAFEETGDIFNPEQAKLFLDNVLSQGGTVHPAELYRRFRGHDATIDALLRRDGITPPAPKPEPQAVPQGAGK